jgi:arylsulfatase A-like enzyme
VKFTRGYATASVCSPSRAALMSGQYQQRHGFEYLATEGAAAIGLTPEQRIFPELLQKAGYRTSVVGKWHLGSTPDRLPTARGFDSFYGFLPGELAFIDANAPGAVSLPAPYLGTRSFHRKLDWTQLVRSTAGAAPTVIKNDQEYLTDVLTREAVRFIEANRNKPYFLYLPYNAPHSPFQAKASDVERFKHIEDPLQRVYAAMIANMDDGIGRLMEAVERSGRAEDTIIIFTADNGAATYLNVSDCTELAGGKLSYFEGGPGCPLSSAGPDNGRKAVSTNATCHSWTWRRQSSRRRVCARRGNWTARTSLRWCSLRRANRSCTRRSSSGPARNTPSLRATRS